MIEISHLSKTYYNNDGSVVEVFKDISCNIEKGEVVSIIGPSGTGKSTLLRCINMIEKPTGGKVVFNGQNLTDRSTDINLVRQKMGMVFQNFNLFNNMTVLSNVMFGPVKLLKMPADKARSLAMEILCKVGLEDKADVMPSMLSGGQKQRAAIARCLAMGPECILFDEPTSALDPTMVGEVLSVIRQLATQGMTMLIVTHEMKFAMDVSTRILFLDKGCIIEDGTPEQIFKHPREPETRQFINRLRTIHFDYNSGDIDLYKFNAVVDGFCEKYGAKRQLFNIELVFEEMMFNILKGFDKVSVDIEYSELTYNQSLKFLIPGVDHKLMENADDLSVQIIRGLSHEIKETAGPEGLLIEIK